MKILYFDINGTLTRDPSDRAKPCLADGAFEREVRAAGIQKLVCVSSMVGLITTYRKAGREVDGHNIIFEHCRGTIQDELWFRRVTDMELDYHRRVEAIQEDSDWWYVDDYAQEYCERAGRYDLIEEQMGKRIFAPEAAGDGSDVVKWLQGPVCGKLTS